MIRDRFHSIWFISGWTLFKAEAPGSVLVRTPTKFQMFNIVEDSSRNCLWLVGNHGNEVKLYRFDYQTQAVKLLNVNLKAHFIKSAALDSKNRLWLGSWGDGLYISDPDVARFERINTTPGRQQIQNPSHSMILDIDIDRNGIAWLVGL